ncbi:MAG: hypothetical protein ACE37B_16345 [Ilumatobacter sp.]|jgi:hypothetical protein|uniref:hypothetical protein n=1 Tax=Ilumatobacter sp. TaxID=1967498 RepID=UPI003919A72E
MWLAALDPAMTGDDGSTLTLEGAIVFLVLVSVFGAGLAWIRSQRRSGKTTKFPRIG